MFAGKTENTDRRYAYDAIIVGSGIIGCCTAFELAQKGYRTLNVDKLASAGAGSTANSCAVIRVHYSTLDGTALAFEGYHYWNAWRDFLGMEDPRGMAEFYKRGIMVFKSGPNQGLKTICGHLTALGIPYEDLDVAAIKAKNPLLDNTSYAPPRRPEDPRFGVANRHPLEGAIYYSHGGYISDPVLSTLNVQVAAESHGADFRFKSEVVAIPIAGGRVQGVHLADGSRITAPVVVNAAGPHSFIINRLAGVEAGMKIRTRALRHEVVHVPAPEGFDFEAHGCPSSDSDVGAYWRPEVGNHILSGSEDPECDPKEWIDDPDDFNRSLTDQARVQACRLALRMPELRIPNQLQGVVDLYDVADDWIPIYDKSDLPGFYMAVGTSGNQYKNAPVVGKLMAALITACEQGRDHDEAPLTFHLEKINRDIDLGFYSRLREINAESSFSVLG